MEDALRLFALLTIPPAIACGFYKLCLFVVRRASNGTSSLAQKRLGAALVVFALIVLLLGGGLFAWSGPSAPPLWLKVLGGVGFWGWWTFLLAGLACLEDP